MADDRDPDGPTPGEKSPDRDAGRSAAEADNTREFDPFADGEEPAAAADPGRTARVEQPGDETRQLPAVNEAGDETRQAPSADGARDETRQLPAADETRQIPAADETVSVPPPREAWSGRAGVPPPEAAIVRGPVTTEWVPPPEDGGKWWMPIVIGIVALLLLGGLIAGIYLIYNANKVEPSPTPTPSPTLAPTSAPATSAAPTTSPTPPPTTAPEGVALPRLVGLSDQDARDELDELGLSYRLVYRPAEAPPDTVIETDPAEGEVVPPGTEVTLVIASPLAPTDPPTTAPANPEPSPTS